MRIKGLLVLGTAALVAVCIGTGSAAAHTIGGNGTVFPPNNNTQGCFYPWVGIGESGGGQIHLAATATFGFGTCAAPAAGGDFTSGAGLLMLLKNTGNGPYGGWSICASWPVTQGTAGNDGGGYIGRHVDAPISCGSGTYAGGFCSGPTGYSSLYWAGHSTYSRNCAGNYVNWAFTNGTHSF